MQAQALERKQPRISGSLAAEFSWSDERLERGELPEDLPRVVRERTEELLSLGCRKGDALAQAQGERHIRIMQRMRVIRHQGPFALAALRHAASWYPYESLECDGKGLRQECLLAYCAYLDLLGW